MRGLKWETRPRTGRNRARKETLMSAMVPKKWDMESDVVVMGYGAAGAVAAITAHDNGASVLVLEKMPSGGGNSRVSGGNILVPQAMEFLEYLDTLSYGTVEREIIETFVTNAMKNGDWIREMGGDYTILTAPGRMGGPGFPEVPHSQHMVKINVKGDASEGPASARLWNFLSGNVERREIQVLTSTPAKELIKDQRGRIVGITAQRGRRTLAIKAKRAVIMTCGGFQADEALKWDYLPVKPIRFLGNPGNSGDGIRMVQKIGAALWHMTGLACSIGFQAPGYEAGFGIRFRDPGYIYVDKYGKRYIDEPGIEGHEFWRAATLLDTEHVEFPRLPVHAIFDDKTRQGGPLYAGTGGFNRDLYKWSADNSGEIAKGWIVQASSIGELADRISVDRSNLEATIAKYNEYCAEGQDPEFGRRRANLRAIDVAPYYSIDLWPSLLNTQGGPRRDKEARVLDPDGNPIPRLYSAGEFGSIWGFMYQGAGNLGECFVFGQIAGRNAAAQKPWK